MVKKLLQVVAPGKNGDRRSSLDLMCLGAFVYRVEDNNVVEFVETKSAISLISETSDGSTNWFAGNPLFLRTLLVAVLLDPQSDDGDQVMFPMFLESNSDQVALLPERPAAVVAYPSWS